MNIFLLNQTKEFKDSISNLIKGSFNLGTIAEIDKMCEDSDIKKLNLFCIKYINFDNTGIGIGLFNEEGNAILSFYELNKAHSKLSIKIFENEYCFKTDFDEFKFDCCVNNSELTIDNFNKDKSNVVKCLEGSNGIIFYKLEVFARMYNILYKC